MTSVTAWNSIEGLPKQFIKSLRVLFDILDEQRCGYVRLVDIESRWHEEGVKGLPSGVIEALRKVTPQNGYLSFDRFVAGLKLSMLTNRNPKQHDDNQRSENNAYTKHNKPHHGVSQAHQQHEKENRTANGTLRRTSHARNEAPPPPRRSSQSALNQHRYHTVNTAAVKPNNVLNALHDRSNIRKEMQDHSDKYSWEKLPPSYNNKHHEVPVSPVSKTSIDSHSTMKDNNQNTNANGVPPQVPPRDKSKGIIKELKNWQRRINEPEQPGIPVKEHFHHASSDSRLLDKNPPHPAGYGN